MASAQKFDLLAKKRARRENRESDAMGGKESSVYESGSEDEKDYDEEGDGFELDDAMETLQMTTDNARSFYSNTRSESA